MVLEILVKETISVKIFSVAGCNWFPVSTRLTEISLIDF